MPATAKAVLMSLADQANDAGVCWPSVGTIATRTCLAERTVQNAISWLCESGILLVQRTPGRSTNFQITPSTFGAGTPGLFGAPARGNDGLEGVASRRTPAGAAPTPAGDAPRRSRTPPPQEMHPTPAAAAGAPAGDAPRTVKEPSPNHESREKAPKALTSAELVAAGLTEQTAQEWLQRRRQRRAPLTARAWEGIVAEAAAAGWAIEAAIRKALSRGWQSVEADWLAKETRGGDRGGGVVDVGYGLETPKERAARERIHEITGGLTSRRPTAAAVAVVLPDPPMPPLLTAQEHFDAIGRDHD